MAFFQESVPYPCQKTSLDSGNHLPVKGRPMTHETAEVDPSTRKQLAPAEAPAADAVQLSSRGAGHVGTLPSLAGENSPRRVLDADDRSGSELGAASPRSTRQFHTASGKAARGRDTNGRRCQGGGNDAGTKLADGGRRENDVAPSLT